MGSLKVMSRVAKVVTVVFVTLALAGSVAVGTAIYSSAHSDQTNCEGVNEVRLSLQAILTRSQSLALQNPDYTPLEKKTAQEFYARAIKDLEPRAC